MPTAALEGICWGMRDPRAYLAQANRDLGKAVDRIARQEDLIDQLERRRRPTAEAEEFLGRLIEAAENLRVFQGQLEREYARWLAEHPDQR